MNSRFSIDSEDIRLNFSHTHAFWLVEGFKYFTSVGVEGQNFTSGTLYKDINVHPFNTDLATLPWWIQWRLKKLGAWNLPSIVHDYMLQHRKEFPNFTRKMIDRVFREACLDQGVGEYECKLLYAGVRANSWWKEERFY